MSTVVLNTSDMKRTGIRRVYTAPLTAGAIWDSALESDWPARECGLALLDGLPADAPATVTPIFQSRGSSSPYQRPRVSRVEVAEPALECASCISPN